MPARKRPAAAPRRTAPADVAVDDPGSVRSGSPAKGRELRARGRATMRRLLDAGVEVFAKRGFHAARVDDIVKAARTSHGTFYLYFSSKEDLFGALVADVADELAQVRDALEPVTPDAAGRAAIRTWLAAFADVYERYGPIIRTWTEAEMGTNDAGRVGEDVLGGLAEGLVAKVDGYLPPDTDADIASLAIVAMVERFNYFVLSGQVRADRDKALDTLAGVVHAGLFGLDRAS